MNELIVVLSKVLLVLGIGALLAYMLDRFLWPTRKYNLLGITIWLKAPRWTKVTLGPGSSAKFQTLKFKWKTFAQFSLVNSQVYVHKAIFNGEPGAMNIDGIFWDAIVSEPALCYITRVVPGTLIIVSYSGRTPIVSVRHPLLWKHRYPKVS